MAKKIIGYAKLMWTCPNCQTENPGTEKVCAGCGAPQPPDVAFHQPAQQQLLQDQEEIKRAKAGADIHCGFCGTRNPATATVCSQCGSDLSAGTSREAGSVVGAFQNGQVAADWVCEHCGHQNLGLHSHCVQCGATRAQPSQAPGAATVLPSGKGKRKWLLPLILGSVFLVIVIFIVVALSRKQDLTGYVSGTSWQRSVQVESFGPVQKEDWRDKIPGSAVLGTCEYRYRGDQDQPAPRSTEVCGTPYSVDLGNGNAEVVQDCVYQVYEEFCNYSVDAWFVSDELSLKGADLNPQWPSSTLSQNQRLGNQNEVYTVEFRTDDGIYKMNTTDVSEYLEFFPGSKWILTINALNNLTDVVPAN